MSSEFYELPDVEVVIDLNAFKIPRAKALADAVEKHRHFSIIQLLRKIGVPGKSECVECVVVEVELDGVPPADLGNININYRERLALCVPEDRRQLVEVLALRKEFPLLLHQNQIVPGTPASLCLYFEPVASVLRTWTPQKFLKRIQWWLEASCLGQIHAADQAVEQLFLVSPYELILPWNFNELRENPQQKFVVYRQEERPGGGETFIISTEVASGNHQKSVTPLEVTVSPVLHGHIESAPISLGMLSESLFPRGVDFAAALRVAVQERVDEKGIPLASDETFSILLTHIPIQRERGTSPERIDLRAFFIPVGALDLGRALGALLLHDKRYFRAIGIIGAEESVEWQGVSIVPMEVLRCNNVEAARAQSGLVGAGPNGVLVGVGSLGSAMANLWGRSGWGQWTVIDKDHIKPHNISRHTAFASHIGIAKTSVVEGLHNVVMNGASKIIGLCADATDVSREDVRQALEGASLIVDASTTLEYPRLASTCDTVGRHFSAFVTPNGDSAVLLAEDVGRTVRLRTLEAQYYRAIINQSWGETHLSNNLGTFWSGASCRDISTVMPYSRIVGYAGILVEQIQQADASAAALIRVWSRAVETGEIVVYDVPVVSECCMKFGELELFFDKGLEEKLRAMRLGCFPSETGGVLLGYYDFNVNSIVVVDALPSPEDSESSPVMFERGVAGLAAEVEEVSRRTGGVVEYIGEWHSHPPRCSSRPSKADMRQLAYLTQKMADDGLPAISLIVGEDEIQILYGETVG